MLIAKDGESLVPIDDLIELRKLYSKCNAVASLANKTYKIEGPIKIQLNVSNPEAETEAVRMKERYPNLEITIQRNY